MLDFGIVARGATEPEAANSTRGNWLGSLDEGESFVKLADAATRLIFDPNIGTGDPVFARFRKDLFERLEKIGLETPEDFSAMVAQEIRILDFLRKVHRPAILGAQVDAYPGQIGAQYLITIHTAHQAGRALVFDEPTRGQAVDER